MKTTRTKLFVALCVAPLVLAGCNRTTTPEETADTAVPRAETVDDEWLNTAIEARLYAEDAVRAEDVDVSVQNGIVTLSGTVGSDAAEQRALTIARGVEGVTRVDDQITVRGATPTTGEASAAESPDPDRSPAWITTKIQAQYFVSPEIKPWNIDVTTRRDGTVTLRGDVDRAEDRAEAVRIAKTTEGVTAVEDRLRVRGESAADDPADLETADAVLTAKVQSKYFLDDDVKGLDIDVTTEDGVVTLRGTVDSAFEKRHAVALARNTDGVTDVRDELQVQATDARGDAPAEARGTAGSGVVETVEDAWITTKIQAQYYLDDDVKGHRVDVDTNNGIVTLTGAVDAAAAKQAAEQIASQTEGVSRVVNRLTVAPQP